MNKKLTVLIAFIFLLGIFLGLKLSNNQESTNIEISENKENNNQRNEETNETQYKPNENYNPESAGCSGKGTVKFTSSPRKIEDIGFIEPMGMMLSQHVTPIDHGYFYPKNWKQNPALADLTDVYASADGVITSIQRMPTFFSVKSSELEDYRIVLHHTCTFYSIYIHIYQLDSKIKEIIKTLEPSETTYPSIPIKAGERIGRAHAFDFSVHNDEFNLSGFLVPEHYASENWKIHTVDPFDYFIEPIKSELLAKNLRTTKPYYGKIDHDQDGKLIGNWFVENTNGYAGIKQPEYWVTHASFSPNVLDSNHFIVSLGDFNGEAKQFGAKGNAPKPEKVSQETGLVKYELVDIEYLIGDAGEYWNRVSYAKNLKAKNQDQVQGLVLVQLIDKRKLKLETFPGKTATEVQGFTSKAVIYER